MRVLVCGGRNYTDHLAVGRALRPYKPVPWNAVSEHIIIHGGCPTGTDSHAAYAFGALLMLASLLFIAIEPTP